jgi:hypothetical protein
MVLAAGVADPDRIATSIQVLIHLCPDLANKSNYKIGACEYLLFANQPKLEIMSSFILCKPRLIHVLSGLSKLILMIVMLSWTATSELNASPEKDAKTVAALDTKYQAATKANDAITMDQILADDFVLVTGRGRVLVKPI